MPGVGIEIVEAILLAMPNAGVLFVLERFSGRRSNGTQIPYWSGPMGAGT